MSARKRKFANSTWVDVKTKKKLNLLYVCGYCTKLVDDDKDTQLEHVSTHEEEISYCRTCCIPLKKDETDTHLKDIHTSSYRQIKLNIDKSLIELRIQAGKSFSNFWGLTLSAEDPTLEHFRAVTMRWWNNFKNGRSLGCFRVIKSKIYWKCSICRDVKPANVFDDTISMRSFALAHLQRFHFDELMINVPGFLDFEWHILQEEVDFDIKELMNIAIERSHTTHRSYFTFYTISLSGLKNGEKLFNKLKRNEGADIKTTRYCLICCSLVPIDMIKSHFRAQSHRELEPVAESTAFVLVPEMSEVCCIEMEDTDGGVEVKDLNISGESAIFEFPKELFVYTKVFKSLRHDEFKWRCCLCPRAHALTFATQIIMRMYVLRHIDEHHRFLFTEEFLAFEWKSLKHEMRASFDIREFSPLDYTIKGEATFNNRNPNDYMLPQQYYFLTKEVAARTVVCGFCYRSFCRNDFIHHIAVHGFGVVSSEECELGPVVHNKTVQDLMGRNNYSVECLEDEPHNILTVDGKRLKSKMELANENRSLSNPRFSQLMTPQSGFDTDGEGYTPGSRKSAMDARRVLMETFKVLQENSRNRKNTWNEFSSSSSSDDDNSDDDRFEKELEIEATTQSERREKSKSKEIVAKKLEEENSKNPKIDITKMKPAEIRRWIREEAEKRGVPWTDNTDSSESDSESDDSNDEQGECIKRNKWDSMKPNDIKAMLQEAAKQQKISFSEDISSSSDSDV